MDEQSAVDSGEPRAATPDPAPVDRISFITAVREFLTGHTTWAAFRRHWEKNPPFAVLFASVVLLAAVYSAYKAVWTVHGFMARESEPVTESHIRQRLFQIAEKDRQKLFDEADKALGWKTREEIRAEAARLYELRVSRAAELAHEVAEFAANRRTAPVLSEMTRLLSRDGVPATLAYIEEKKSMLLDEAKRRSRSIADANHESLTPLLLAADIYIQNGQHTEAVEILQSVLSVDGLWPEARHKYAQAMIDIGYLSLYHRDFERAAELAGKAIAILNGPSIPAGQTAPDRIRALLLLGNALVNKPAITDAGLGETMIAEAVRQSERYCAEHPDIGAARDLLASSLGGYALLLRKRGGPGDISRAIELSERVVSLVAESETGEGAMAKVPHNATRARASLAYSLSVRHSAGDLQRACNLWDRCIALLQLQHDTNPTSVLITRTLFETLLAATSQLSESADKAYADKANEYADRASGLAAKLKLSYPQSQEISAMLIDATIARCDAQKLKGKLDSASEFYRYEQLWRQVVPLIQKGKISAELEDGYQQLLTRLAKVGDDAAKDVRIEEKAIPFVVEAFSYSRSRYETHAGSDLLLERYVIAAAIHSKYAFKQLLENESVAIDEYRRALDACEKRPKLPLSDTDISARTILYLNLSALVMRARGPDHDAKVYCEKAISWAEEALRRRPDDIETQQILADALGNLGAIIMGVESPAASTRALAFCQRSLEIDEHVLKSVGPTDAAICRVATGHYNLGALLLAAGRTSEGHVSLRRAYDLLSGEMRQGHPISPFLAEALKSMERELGSEPAKADEFRIKLLIKP